MKIEIDIQEKYEELKVIIRNDSLTEEVTGITERLKAKPESNTLIGYEEDRFVILKHKEVYMFFAQQGKVIAVLKDKKFKMKEKLYQLEDAFTGKGFVRISKSAIINLNYVASVEASFDGGLMVIMKNKEQEIISRRYVKKVKETLGIGGK